MTVTVKSQVEGQVAFQALAQLLVRGCGSQFRQRAGTQQLLDGACELLLRGLRQQHHGQLKQAPRQPARHI